MTDPVWHGHRALTETLVAVLERSRSLGFLGPGPIDEHIEHAALFRDALPVEAARIVDLGSGGGVPGLPLVVGDPRLQAVLVDASQKRCSFLAWAAAELGVTDRVDVWCARAEELAHEDRAREQFDAVVARGFGPPASTVECAAALVRRGGRVVISEPPVRRRWPSEELAEVGLTVGPVMNGVAVFERAGAVDDTTPRPMKQQRRSPLFEL